MSNEQGGRRRDGARWRDDAAAGAAVPGASPGKQTLTGALAGQLGMLVQRKAVAAPVQLLGVLRRDERIRPARSPLSAAATCGLEDEAPADTSTARYAPVQRDADRPVAQDPRAVQQLAAEGIAGTGGRVPHADAIKESFGPHGGIVDNVQAHVGGRAAAAAHGMGAHAYATGEHIAFGIEPDLHTTAHEVAHVAQQRNGVQLKSGVGEVGDAYEQHADAVADRVVAGRSAADLLGPVGSSSTRSSAVQHKKGPPTYSYARPLEIKATGTMPHDDYAKVADDAEAATEKQEATEVADDKDARDDQKSPEVIRVGNDYEVGTASRLMNEIEGYRPNLVKGIHDGMIPESALATNIGLVKTLGDFVATGGEQGRALSNFQARVQTLRKDMARFKAQVQHFKTENPGILDDQSLIEALGGQQHLKRAAEHLVTSGGGGTKLAMQTKHDELDSDVSDAAAGQEEAIAARHSVLAALNEIEGGVTMREAKETEGASVLETSSKVKEVLGFGVEHLFEHFNLPAKDAVVKGTAWLVDKWFEPAFRELGAKQKETAAVQEHGASEAQHQTLVAAVHRWAAATARVYAAIHKMDVLKTREREDALDFASAAEERDEVDLGTAAQMFAEADTLTSECDLVVSLGEAEVSAAADSTSAATLIKKGSDGAETFYYEPQETYSNAEETWWWPDPRTIGVTFEAVKRKVEFTTDAAGEFGWTEGDHGVNPVVAKTLAEVREFRAWIGGIRDQLQLAIDLGKNV